MPGLPLSPVADFGWMGVDLFFVLSGYLIASQLFKLGMENIRLRLVPFYISRALRIMPAYLLVLLFYFTFPTFNEEPGIPPLWQFITFTENLFNNFYSMHAFSHAWSLCIEEQFYLFFPIILIWLSNNPSIKKTVSIVLSIIIFGITIRGYIWQHDLAPLQNIQSGADSLFVKYHDKIYYPTYTRLDDLLAGCTIASIRFFRPIWWQRCLQYSNVVLLIGILCLIGSLFLFYNKFSLWPTMFGYPLLALGLGLIVLASISPHSIIGAFKIPLATTIATISYSLYLTHKCVFYITKLYLIEFGIIAGYESLFIHLVSAIMIAALLYWYIERPFLKLRKIFNKTHEHNTPIYSFSS